MKITFNSLTVEAETEEQMLSLIANVLPLMREAIGQPAKASVSHLANANPNGEDGPNVLAYLAATGGQRFKITQAEKESGYTREQAAGERLRMMEAGEVAGGGSGKGEAMPEDNGEDELA